MPGRRHGDSIKCPEFYEALRRKGYSKAKAARISNGVRQRTGRCGGGGGKARSVRGAVQ